jgi:hypothetical protein
MSLFKIFPWILRGKTEIKIIMKYLSQRSRDAVVGIATHYGLEGPGIEFRWRRDFPHLSRPAPRPTQPSVQ